LDERLAAHLDGVAVARQLGAQMSAAALESPGPGQVFVAAVGAIQSGRAADLEKLFALVETVVVAQKGLASAFGWVSRDALKGTASALLNAADPFLKRGGITACALHRVDPGVALNAAISSHHAFLRARALRCAGELGRRDLLQHCVEGLINADDATCAFWASWSAALLGNRGPAIDSLRQLSLEPSPYRKRALQLVLKILDNDRALGLLKALGNDPANQRLVVRGAGIAGDPQVVPWLIEQMDDPELSRVAGEAFSVITGLDLAYLDLDRKPPEAIQPGPNDDPDDANVDMDEDESLPWPDSSKIADWWRAHGARFVPGMRYFMGAPPTAKLCFDVLKAGFQRQRIAAAEYMTLFSPGTPVFNTAAPSWRQQRLLAQMVG